MTEANANTETEVEETVVPQPEPGLLWKASVQEIGEKHVLVSLADGGAGRFDLREAKAADGNLMVSVGDEVEVLLDEMQGEVWDSSMEKAEKLRVFERLSQLAAEKTTVSGLVTRRIREGLAVDIGVRAILPARESGMRNHELNEAVGTSISCQVIRFNDKKGEVILSRKDLAQKEAAERKEALYGRINVGDRIKGVVSSLTSFGAFVDIDGGEGLLHVSEMSWDRVNSPGDVVSVGDELDVEIVKIDREKGRIGLSRKSFLENPWDVFERENPVGSKTTGTVRSLTEFGAFVTIGGIDGLVHVSEVSWDRGIKHAGDVLSIDQEVEVLVHKIDKDKRRIGLSIKRLQPNPWEVALAEIKVNSHIKGKVRNITDFGVFVEVVPGVEGLVHVSDMSWDKRIDKPADLRDFVSDEEIEVKVLSIDTDKNRIRLGIKQLQEDPWDAAKLDVGKEITVTINRLESFGAFAQVAPGLEGLIHVSEISSDGVGHPKDALRKGQEVKVLILSAHRDHRKISLSIKAQVEKEFGALKEYNDESPQGDTQLGSLLKAKGLVPADAAPAEEAAEAQESAPVEEAVEAAPEAAEAAPVEEKAEAAPVAEAKTEDAPAEEAVEAAPAEEEVAEAAPVEEKAEETVEAAPEVAEEKAEAAPAEEAAEVVETAPAEEAPAEEAVEAAPAKEAAEVVEAAPAEEAKAEAVEEKTEEAAPEEAAEAAPVEEAKAEEAPAEEEKAAEEPAENTDAE